MSKILLFLKVYDPIENSLKLVSSDMYSRGLALYDLVAEFIIKAGLRRNKNYELFIELPCTFP
jgi:hypothetical protein